MMNKRIIKRIPKNLPIFIYLVLILLPNCQSNPQKKLPIFGPKQLSRKSSKDPNIPDTIYHTIEDFVFTDQNGEKISNQTFKGKIYVCDFIFTNCPTICPVMTKKMYKVQQAFVNQPEVMFLSHTVDPERDSAEVLKKYAEKNKANEEKWHFVTGNKEDIYRLGLKNYMISLDENEVTPGGFLHSGAFILVDKQRHIRGVYNGIEDSEIDRLIGDIRVLLKESP